MKRLETLLRLEPAALFICCFVSSYLTPIHALIESDTGRIMSWISIVLQLLDLCVVLHACYAPRSLNTKDRLLMLSSSALPSLMLIICYCMDHSNGTVRMAVLLLRLLKLVSLKAQYKTGIQSLEGQSLLISETSSRILFVALLSTLYASTMACIWFAISCNSWGTANCRRGNNWVAADIDSGLMEYPDSISQYFRSLHFVMQTLLTIGYGDIHPVNLCEVTFSLVLIMSGALFYGYVIACITSLLSSRDITTKLFRHDLNSLRNYLKLRKAEDRIRDAYSAYLEFLYSRQLGLSEETVLAALPEHVSREIKLATCLACLKSVPFFKTQANPDEFAEKCAQKLRFVSYGPDSVVCAKGSADRIMYLIRSGKIDLIAEQSRKPILSLIAGDYVGDYHMVFGFPVEVEAVSAGFTEVATLSFTSLVEVMECCRTTVTAQRRSSLLQFTDELQQFRSCQDCGVDDQRNCDGAPADTLGVIPEPEIPQVSESMNASASLNMVRLKPLPTAAATRRHRKSLAGAVAAGGAPASVTAAEVRVTNVKHRNSGHVQSFATRTSLISTSSSTANQSARLSNSSTGSASQPVTKPPAMYRSSLRATFDAHQALLKRVEKTQTSIAQTARTKKLAEMMEQQESAVQAFTIRPDHYFRCCWDVCVALVVLYYNLAIPLRIMARFHCDTDSSELVLESLHGADACLSRWDWSLAIDYLCDAVLLVDFLLRARYFAFRRFEGEREVIETDRQAIWRLFNQSFRCALLVGVIVPIDLLAPLTGYLLVLRMTKISSILLLTTIIQDIQQWLDHERGVSISAEAITVTHLTLFTIVATCWMSVGWCILHYNGAQSFNWVSAFYWCLTTMTTTGYGDITPADTRESMNNILISIVGPTIFATIIAKFASYVKKVDASTNNMEHRLAAVSQFVRTIHAGSLSGTSGAEVDAESSGSLTLQAAPAASPFAQDLEALTTNSHTESASCKVDSDVPQLFRAISGLSAGLGAGAVSAFRNIAARSSNTSSQVTRALSTAVTMKYRPSQDTRTKQGVEAAVAEYFGFMDRGGQRLAEEMVLPPGSLSQHMQVGLRAVVLEDLLHSIPIFVQCDKAFLQTVMMSFQQQLFPRKAVLIDRAVPEGMYLVKTGSLGVQEVGQDRYCSKHAGQYIGERALFDGLQDTALEVIARADCEVWFLSRTSFENILNAHPQKAAYLRTMHTAFIKVPAVLARQQSLNVSVNLSTSISASLNGRAMFRSNPARRGNEIVHATDVQAFTQRLQETSQRKALIIHPDGLVGICWTFLLTLVTMYNFIVIPLRIAYFQGCHADAYFIFDYAGDALYLTDIVLRMFCIAYYERDDLVEVRSKIRANYIKTGRVYGDVLSVLPFDLIALAGPLGTLGVAQVLSLFRINRLIRLRDANSGFKMLETSVTKWLKSKSRSQKNAIRLVKLIVTIFLIAHMFGCCFFMVANQLHLSGDAENWAEKAGLFALPATTDHAAWSMQPTSAQVFTQYVASIYWAIALLTTVGYGDISPVNDWEKAYNIVLFVIGTLVYAMVIVHLQDIVSELDVTSDIFKGRVGKLQAFLSREAVGPEFNLKVRGYMDRLWSAQRGARSDEIQAFMPAPLYCATVNSCVSKHLPQLFFVHKCHAAFQRAFLSRLRVVHYIKDEHVFRTSEAAQKLYFIAQGEVSLVSMDLQTDTNTSLDAPIMKKRNSLLSTFGTRRISLQGLVKAPAATAPPLSVKLSPPPFDGVQPKRFSLLSLRPRTSLISNLPMDAPGGPSAVTSQFQRKAGNKRTSYLKVHDGFIGEMEFFTRACYSCSAKTNSDTILLEMEFSEFWALVLYFNLQAQYAKVLKRDGAGLHHNSTLSVVQKLDTNMANKKMARMMSVCVVEAPQVHSIAPDAFSAQIWNVLTLTMLLLMAICVPYFTAFPRICSVVLQLALDSLVTVVFSIDMYLRMHIFAVLDDGVTISEPSSICAHYMTHYFQLDAAATFPVALLVFAASQDPVAYGACRWLFLLRLNKASFLLDSVVNSVFASAGQTASEGMKRVFAAVLGVLYIAHVAGCLFCTVGRLELQSGRESWLSANDWDSGADVSIYLRSYYWALYTLTTVGYGSVAVPTNTERLFAIGVMIMGSILNAMLSALLSSMVESSDQSRGLIRRAAEAASKFCRSNQIDASTQDQVTAYYKYLSEELNSSPEIQDFALLSSSLRAELVLRTAWRSLRRIAYLDFTLYEKAHQHGFVLSLARKMHVYLAVPGQVLASAPLLSLLAEQAQLQACDTTGTGTAVAGALQASTSKKARKRRKQKLFYKGIDMMVLRRGVVAVSLEGGGASQTSTGTKYLSPGQVVNMYAIVLQLTTGRSRFSAKSSTSIKSRGSNETCSDKCDTQQLQDLQLCSLVVTIDNDAVVRWPSPARAYCELHCEATSSQRAHCTRSSSFSLPGGVVEFSEPIRLNHSGDVVVRVFLEDGNSSGTDGTLIGSARVAAAALDLQQRRAISSDSSSDATSTSQSVTSSDSDCTDIDQSEGQDDQHGTCSVDVIEPKCTEAEAGDARSIATSGSDGGNSSHSEEEDQHEPVQDLFAHIHDFSRQNRSLVGSTASMKTDLSGRFSSAPLQCISEESEGAGADRGARHEYDTQRAVGVVGAGLFVEADLMNSTDDVCIGKVSLTCSAVPGVHANDAVTPEHLQESSAVSDKSAKQRDSIASAVTGGEGGGNGDDESAAVQVVVRAESFSHFFRVTAAECREMEEYFRLSRMAVHQRL